MNPCDSETEREGNFAPLPSTGRHLMTQSSTTSTLSTPKNPKNLISPHS
jgi:hypothetical protein